MPKGRVSETLGADAIKEVLGAVKTIKHHLPFLVALSLPERKGMLKLGPKSIAFVSGVRKTAAASPELVPAAYDLPEFERDVELLESFKEFAPQFQQLAESVEDTQMVAGGEAMATALLLYGSFKNGRKVVPGLDGALAEMGARFKRGPKRKKV